MLEGGRSGLPSDEMGSGNCHSGGQDLVVQDDESVAAIGTQNKMQHEQVMLQNTSLSSFVVGSNEMIVTLPIPMICRALFNSSACAFQ